MLIIVGALFFFIGSFLIKSYGDKDKCTEPVSAVVTENVEHKSSSRKHRRKITYAPVFEYEYNGKAYTYKSNIYSKPAEYSVGEKTTIYVNPNAPEKVYYKPKGSAVVMNVVFKVVGVGVAVGGVAMLVHCLIKKKNEAF